MWLNTGEDETQVPHNFLRSVSGHSRGERGQQKGKSPMGEHLFG